jgi:formylglycine-generating enzyme required for sulfatase activity
MPCAAFAQESHDALSVFQDCEECPEMIVLPVGSFVMGAGPEYDDLDAMTGLGPFREAFIEGVRASFLSNERPAHEVSVSAPVALSKYEVTVGQIEAYVKETGAKIGGNCMVRLADSGPHAHKVTGTRAGEFDYFGLPNVVGITDGSPSQPGLPVTNRHPATCINRDEVLGYLAWLSEKTGREYRLPSEAEWEYATRAGTQTFAFWGNDMSEACQHANFGDQASPYQMSMAAPCAEAGDALWAAEVGQYEPNAWGFHDTVGNVQEMVSDCLHEGYEGSPTDGSAWMEPDCQIFVARGGDWELPVTAMRSSERLLYGYGPDAPALAYGEDSDLSPETLRFLTAGRANGIGFRAAVDVE